MKVNLANAILAKAVLAWVVVLSGVLMLHAPSSFATSTGLYGTWKYSSAIMVDEEGKTYNSTVSGTLDLNKNGTWKMSRYIGSIGGFGDGKFSAKNGAITLRNKTGGIEFDGKYTLGTHKDSDGKVFQALTLDKKSKDGSRLTYLLVRE